MNTRQLALLLFAGTAVRFMYGYFSKAWLASPDQLAWGLGIDEMLSGKTWNYTQLTHAPHEGAGVFIGWLSILFRPLQFIMPSLSLVALSIDTISRFIQISIVKKMFGNETALWFGIWTVLSIPLLIPWATVNYGLHSLFSFVPFVCFYFAIRYKESRYLPVFCGIICAVALSFSYDSVIFVPAFIFFVFVVTTGLKNKLTRILIFLGTFSVLLIPHLFLRSFFTTGLSLTGGSYFSDRGLSLTGIFSTRHWVNFFTIWFTSFPGSFLLSSIRFLPALLVCTIVFLFIFIGIGAYISKKDISGSSKQLAAGIIFLFVSAYAFSPFCENSYANTSYVYYRHLCFIIPFVTAIMLQGFIISHTFKKYLVTGWVIVCGIASCQYMFSTRKIDQPAYKAAGWVLARKYGNDVHTLLRIHAVADIKYQDEIITGYGWGLSAAILQHNSDSASVEKLTRITRQFPEKDQVQLVQGIHYSFASGITPVLDKGLIPVMDFHLSQIKR